MDIVVLYVYFCTIDPQRRIAGIARDAWGALVSMQLDNRSYEPPFNK
jgi:hypothetical protein